MRVWMIVLAVGMTTMPAAMAAAEEAKADTALGEKLWGLAVGPDVITWFASEMTKIAGVVDGPLRCMWTPPWGVHRPLSHTFWECASDLPMRWVTT
jgi:hypothetical protein